MIPRPLRRGCSFNQVLKREFGEIKGVPRAKRKPYIPVVLSRNEVELIFDHLYDSIHLIAKLLYGCGLRLFEHLKLRVQDFNFDAGILTIHDSKGKKDLTVPIPQTIVKELKQQLQKLITVHRADMKARYAGAFLPDQLDKEYKMQSGSWSGSGFILLSRLLCFQIR